MKVSFKVIKPTVASIITDLNDVVQRLDELVNTKAVRIQQIDEQVEALEAEKSEAVGEGLRAKRVAAKLNDLLR